MRGRDHLVARREPERADDRVQPRRRVGREHQIIGSGADERGELGACREQPGALGSSPDAADDLSREEVGRPFLEQALEPLVLLEDRQRAGAIAAVVQLDDVGVQKEAFAHR